MRHIIALLSFLSLSAYSTLQDLQPVREFLVGGGDVRKILISPDGNTLFVMGAYTIHIWDIQSELLRGVHTVVHPENTLADIALNEDATVFAYLVSGLDNKVVFTDVITGARVNIISGGSASLGRTGRPGDGQWKLDQTLTPTNQLEKWMQDVGTWDGTLEPTALAVSGPSRGERTLDHVAVAFDSGHIQSWRTHGVPPAPVLTQWHGSYQQLGPRLVAITPGGGVLWAGLPGWGHRPSRDAEVEIFFHLHTMGMKVADRYELRPLSFTSDGLFFGVTGSCSYALWRLRRFADPYLNDPGALVVLEPDIQTSSWREAPYLYESPSCDRAALESNNRPPVPAFAPLHTSSGFLEAHHEGTANIRNYKGDLLAEFRLLNSGKSEGITAVGVSMKAVDEASSARTIFAVAWKGHLVSVYEVPWNSP